MSIGMDGANVEMITPVKLNELSAVEYPSRELLEVPGWTYMPRAELSSERGRAKGSSLGAAAVSISNRFQGSRALGAGARRSCQ